MLISRKLMGQDMADACASGGNQTRTALDHTLKKMELSGNPETKEMSLDFLEAVAN